MPVSASPRFLRNALLADAASCLGTGALQALFTDSLASVFNLPAVLLASTGWFLLVYGALVGFIAMRGPVPSGWVRLIAAGNLLWSFACVLLVAGRWVTPTPLGAAWILAQAITVTVLALLQWAGLRRSTQVRGWA